MFKLLKVAPVILDKILKSTAKKAGCQCGIPKNQICRAAIIDWEREIESANNGQK